MRFYDVTCDYCALLRPAAAYCAFECCCYAPAAASAVVVQHQGVYVFKETITMETKKKSSYK